MKSPNEPYSTDRDSQFRNTPVDGESSNPQNNFSIQLPKLPKGGGSIQSIDEKFQVNSLNGTASFSLPLPVAPGRGFAPSLSLSYNSGAGNSAFGLGWDVDIPAITRKTDKGLPQYRDDVDSDCFIIAGAEDLVPLLEPDGDDWKTVTKDLLWKGELYSVRRYRPRIEGSFTRIERWQNTQTGIIHWRTLSSANITTLFGQTPETRIADPDDPTQIFTWLIDFSYDDKGHCLQYEYLAEDTAGIDAADPSEKNRLNGLSKVCNRYLNRVSYGNKSPYLPEHSTEPTYHFQTVFDYGTHAETDLPDQSDGWDKRKDPFSYYRAGFEIRTYRRCTRVLLFHDFPELGNTPCLIQSLQLNYGDNDSAGFSFINQIINTGYIRQADGSYTGKQLPPYSFDYQPHSWNGEVHTIPSSELNIGVDQQLYQWVDLYSEGLQGVLTEQGGELFYKHNLGNGQFSRPQVLSHRPSYKGLGAGAIQIQDLEGTGERQLVAMSGGAKGYFALNAEEEWQQFEAFEQFPNIDFSDPNLKIIDINGDGRPDLLISEEHAFSWYPSKGKAGYGPALQTGKVIDEEQGPAILFADASQSIVLADMSGDGLTDIVRIRNGTLCYWPNLGYGRFGAKISMGNAPIFDHPDTFNPAYLRLADLDGSGTTDIVYLGKNTFSFYLNHSGNTFSDVQQVINTFPEIDNFARISVMDLLGTGTSCIVCSSTLPKHSNQPLRYIDLMASKKPHLMIVQRNNMGGEVKIAYKASTHFYLEDKKQGQPWVTRLPFPVQCIHKVENLNHITKTRFTAEYSYHHGYYDHSEKEFRGFGRVDQLDTEIFEHHIRNDVSNVVDVGLYQPPVLSKTWFHTGAFLDKQRILSQYQHEYFKNSELDEYQLPEPHLPGNLSTAEWREALRACKGMTLRSEVYALDESDEQGNPYSVSQTNNKILLIQPRQQNPHASFLVLESESISYQYDRISTDPRIAHQLTLASNQYGQPLRTAAVSYPRQSQEIDPSLPLEVKQEQAKRHVVIVDSSYTNDIDQEDIWRMRQSCETRSFDVTGIAPDAGSYFSREGLNTLLATAEDISIESEPDGSAQKRLLKHSRQLFLKNDLSDPMPLGKMDSLGMGFQSFQMAFTPGLLARIYGDKVDDTLMVEGGYEHSKDSYENEDDNWWVPSSTLIYSPNASEHYYLPSATRDPFANSNAVIYDDYDLLITSNTDALNNTVAVEHDYRTLQAVRMTDPNLNRNAVFIDELGVVIRSAKMGQQGSGEGDTLDEPTTKFEYDQFAYFNSQHDEHIKPNSIHSFARETHGDPTTRWMEKFEYFDGSGNVIMTKVQAKPGEALQINASGELITVNSGSNVRWIGNGRTVLNNKGNAVKQYEPYFSVTPEFEDDVQLVEIGISPVIYYDAVGRAIRTENPNGTLTRADFDPWQQSSWDVNDTVLESDWYQQRGSPNPTTDPEPVDVQEGTAWHAARHANTPEVQHTDALGRVFYSIADNGVEQFATRTILDIESNLLAVTDARGNTVMSYGYDMLPRQAEDKPKPTLFKRSMDGGDRWTFLNILGNPLQSWDGREHVVRSEYDVLHRSINRWLKKGEASEILVGATVYGEVRPDAAALNMRGQVWKLFDQAGLVESMKIDFKGNLLSGQRKLCKEYKQSINWDVGNVSVLLQDEVFVTASEYDALNRVTRSLSPSTDTTPASELLPVYNEAGILNGVKVKLRGGAIEDYVTNIDYDAKGQRQKIEYGNGVSTSYTYDFLTHRLNRLETVRSGETEPIQDLSYTYDPVGNITSIRDAAQQTIFFKNTVVEPSNQYEYDALYRLIKATGREHSGQNGIPGPLSGWSGVTHRNDGQQMQRYEQLYQYDGVGNIEEILHHSGGAGWRRSYQYTDENNRLLATTLGDPAQHFDETYDYNAHGSMSTMPHLQQMHWDYMEQLSQVDLQDGSSAWYVYDGSGQRVRKIREGSGSIRKERIYLNGWEIYRESNAVGEIKLERESLHVMDGQQRIALIETKTIDLSDPISTPEALVRYQLGNHLGSASLELDDDGQVISYEEFHPCGTTAYLAGTAAIENNPKRYRYTGKERDEETGFAYHGARFYAGWLARWCSADPIGIEGGINLYEYVLGNPVGLVDPTGHAGKYIVLDWEKIEKDWRDSAPVLGDHAGLANPGGNDSKVTYLEPHEEHVGDWRRTGPGQARIVVEPERIDLGNIYIFGPLVIEGKVPERIDLGDIYIFGPLVIEGEIPHEEGLFWKMVPDEVGIQLGFSGQLFIAFLQGTEVGVAEVTTLHFLREGSIAVTHTVSAGPPSYTIAGQGVGGSLGVGLNLEFGWIEGELTPQDIPGFSVTPFAAVEGAVIFGGQVESGFTINVAGDDGRRLYVLHGGVDLTVGPQEKFTADVGATVNHTVLIGATKPWNQMTWGEAALAPIQAIYWVSVSKGFAVVQHPYNMPSNALHSVGY